jgi:hypothetical protein
MDRRVFLQRAGGAALGVGVLGLSRVGLAGEAPAKPVKEPHIRRHVTLGKTGLKISDIGGGGFPNKRMVRYCYERGVTYFDTSVMFNAEPIVGRGLMGVRQNVVLTSKYKAMPSDDRHKIMGVLEQSLRKLKTDYIDIYLNHAVNDIARVKNPEWMEFVQLAKKQGNSLLGDVGSRWQLAGVPGLYVGQRFGRRDPVLAQLWHRPEVL